MDGEARVGGERLLDPAERISARREPRGTGATMTERAVGPQAVLLVEDNVDNRIIYGMILTHAGYTVIEAGDGEEGIAKARELRPALILMDVSIPKIDGYSATRILKAEIATAGTPIIALTAHALAGEEQKARAAGCDGYLAKPVEPKRVLEEVRRFIGPALPDQGAAV